jgi:Protein of unknown function (DUF2931)
MKNYLLAILLLLTLASACQKKQDKNMETNVPEFDWVEVVNSPVGYPIEVYRGGFILKNDISSVGMVCGPTSKEKWGDNYSGMNSGVKPLPERLNVIWVAFTENCLYEIDCKIDYNKILHYFNEGYQDSGAFFIRKGAYQKTTYDEVKAGFAPGGVVVIWVEGAGKQIEIGRYQGKKTTIPQKEIDGLDDTDQLLFSQEYYAEILENTQIIPLEVQIANKNKPIPFGLWDTYREKYTWKPTVTSLQEIFIVNEIYLEMFNGEKEELFDQSLVKNQISKRAIPRGIAFGWKDKNGQNYGGNLDFDETEIFNAFREICKNNKNTEIEIELRVNIPNTVVTTWIKGNGKEIGINKKTKTRVFKSKIKR